MKQKRSVPIALYGCGICWLLLSACISKKHLSTRVDTKTQIATFSKDWLQYEVYILPFEKGTKKGLGPKNASNVTLSLRIINKQDNASPLRRICADISQYNVYNEYLLNGAKNEIYLLRGEELIYPIYYSFENNYNAFPFETINVGYTLTRPTKRKEAATLVFVDRVFSKDTIFFNLSKFIK